MAVPAGADLAAAGETVVVDVAEDESILAAAREADLWLPADCQQGWCTTCAARLVEGEVDQSTARRYFDTDEEAGFVLTCTARPRSDCRIEACKHEELLDHRAANDQPPGSAKR